MSNFMVGLLMGIGVGGWVYAKMQHGNGGQTTNSLVVAGTAAIGAAFLIIVLLNLFF